MTSGEQQRDKGGGGWRHSSEKLLSEAPGKDQNDKTSKVARAKGKLENVTHAKSLMLNHW